MAGISIVVSDGARAGTSLGDLLALATAIALAVTFIIIRHNKHVNMIPATAFGALISALIAMPFAEPLQLEGRAARTNVAVGSGDNAVIFRPNYAWTAFYSRTRGRATFAFGNCSRAYLGVACDR